MLKLDVSFGVRFHHFEALSFYSFHSVGVLTSHCPRALESGLGLGWSVLSCLSVMQMWITADPRLICIKTKWASS